MKFDEELMINEYYELKEKFKEETGKDSDEEVNYKEFEEYQQKYYDSKNEKVEKLLQKLHDTHDRYIKQNQFLQLLNKDNNWVTFFIKSIIQDSAKKGYEKVLFPKGETAAKIEGHQTIADEIKSIVS